MSVEKLINEQEQIRKTRLSRRWFAILIIANLALVGYLVYQFIVLFK